MPNLTESFDLDLVRDATTWLRATITARLETAQAATGGRWALIDAGERGEGPWGIQADREHGHEAIATWGCEDGGIERQENGAHIQASYPEQIIADCAFQLHLLDLHAPTTTSVTQAKAGKTVQVPFATCSHCDNGNPFDTIHMGYPCPTVLQLLLSYSGAAGYLPEWAQTPADDTEGATQK